MTDTERSLRALAVGLQTKDTVKLANIFFNLGLDNAAIDAYAAQGKAGDFLETVGVIPSGTAIVFNKLALGHTIADAIKAWNPDAVATFAESGLEAALGVSSSGGSSSDPDPESPEESEPESEPEEDPDPESPEDGDNQDPDPESPEEDSGALDPDPETE